MQISAAALLASQQQVQRAQPNTAQAAFEPMSFKQAAKPAQTAAPPGSAAMQAPTAMPPTTGPVRPGTHLDIKV